MHAPISLRELPLALSNDDRSLQIAIYEALRTAMLDGRLAPGARLPSSRDLAAQLQVARGTVVIAYEHLTAEGYLRSARGAGKTPRGKGERARRAPRSERVTVRSRLATAGWARFGANQRSGKSGATNVPAPRAPRK